MNIKGETMSPTRIITTALIFSLPCTALVRAHGEEAKWRVLNGRALALHRQGNPARAVVVAQNALKVAQANVGPDHPALATCLNTLALIYETQGDCAKAEPLCTRALAIREKTLGPHHPDVATSLRILAVLNYIRGDYAKAEPLYARSLTIREKALGPFHPAVATSLNSLALLYQTLGVAANEVVQPCDRGLTT